MAAAKKYDNAKLRAAMDAAAKKYGTNSKQYAAARTTLNNDLAAHGNRINDLGVGKSSGTVNAAPAAPVAPPAPAAPNAPGPTTGPGNSDNPLGGASGNDPSGYSSYPAPAGANLGSGSLGFSPVGNSSPTSVGAAINQNIDAGSTAQLVGEAGANANVSDPYGQHTVTFDPKTGQPAVTNRLSQANQNVLNSIQGGAVGAGNLVNGFLSSDGTDQNGNPLSALQKANYNKLTGAGTVDGLDQTYQSNKEQAAQTLANRGIPVGSDAYNREMNRLDQNYALAKQGANDSSLQSSFGQLGTINSIQTQGYKDPNFAPFVSQNFQANLGDNPLNTLTGAQNTKNQIAGAQNVAQTQAGSASNVANINAQGIIGAAKAAQKVFI